MDVLTLVDARALKLVAALDVQWRVAATLRPARGRGALRRRRFLPGKHRLRRGIGRLRLDHGQLGTALAPLRGRLVLRGGIGRALHSLLRCGLLLCGAACRLFPFEALALRLFPLGAALLALLGEHALLLERLLLAGAAQGLALLALLPALHAPVIQPLGQAHAQRRERHAGEHHQHHHAGAHQHDHAAPHVERAVERPCQQRADEAAAAAVVRIVLIGPGEEADIARLLPVRHQRGGDQIDLEELKDRLHEQKQQRAADHRAHAHPAAGEEHEHHARPADHQRQQQAQRAAEAAHQQHALVEEPAARGDELAGQRQQPQAQHRNADDAAHLHRRGALPARGRAAAAAHLSLGRFLFGRSLFGHLPTSRYSMIP